ncbi:Septum formation protein Maf [compost metagenome]
MYDSIRPTQQQGIIIGSDTIVYLQGRVLGKPTDEEDSFHMLSALQGKTHQVYSGVALLDVETGRQLVSHRVTQVTIKSMQEDQIRRYIATGEPHGKAGSYAIQGIGAVLIEGIEGDYFNVVGLPLNLLANMLGEMGVQVL